MKFTQLSLFSLCATLVSAVPTGKAGPSGSVAYPAGGTHYTAYGGILDVRQSNISSSRSLLSLPSQLAIGYNTVHQGGDNPAQTISIDITLEPLNMDGPSIQVATGYRGVTSETAKGGRIQGSFSRPFHLSIVRFVLNSVCSLCVWYLPPGNSRAAAL